MVHEIDRAKLAKAVTIYRQAQAIGDKFSELYDETMEEWITAFDAACDKPAENLDALNFCEAIMDYNADASHHLIEAALCGLLGIVLK